MYKVEYYNLVIVDIDRDIASAIGIAIKVGKKMKYIIYLDVFFAINMVMNLIILYGTAHFVKPQTTFLRCVLGATLGSVLAIVSLHLSYDNMLAHTLITYIFTAGIMVYATYGRSAISVFFKRVGCLYAVTVILGGAMNLIYSYTYFGYIVQGFFTTIYANPINIWKLIVFTGLAYVILNAIGVMFTEKKRHHNYMKVALTICDKKVELTGLIDTGNTLICPYYGKAVHVVSLESVKDILEGVDVYSKKYRLVPFNSLGASKGMLEVIECDEINVYRHKDSIYYEKYPAIGIYKGKLTDSKEYEMLLHSIVENNNI